ncbi:MAG TPA: oxidoreductase [Bacteroidales bacterium]|nr:oxidoreductase [Bacteroidales bacterium]
MPEFRLEDIPSLKGKMAIVTGANSGLGFETSKVLAGKGMLVIMACRDLRKAKDARKKITSEHPYSDLEIMQLNLSDLSSVREFCNIFLSRYDHLDLLINNAGVMYPPYSLTKDGFESQMGVNYYSHFLLTGLLIKTITGTPGSRVISLSSNAHKVGGINFKDINWENGYSRIMAYTQSKLACLIFALELDRRIRESGLNTISVAAHPGLSLTELMRYMPHWLMIILKPLTSLLSHEPDKASLPVLYAALADDVTGGEYFGPQGFGEWKGKPGRAKRSNNSSDIVIANRLWDISEKATGIKFQL